MIETKAIQIAEKTNYLNKDIIFLKNIPITEYDIKSAGFSVIKFLKLMSEEEIKKLEDMPKEERNICIGKKIIKEPSISEKIIRTLESVRKAFVFANKIDETEILSIKKDAFFIIKNSPQILSFKDYFLFRKKATYTSYLYVGRKEFYFDSLNNILEIKGLSEEVKKAQEDYFLKDVKSIMRSCEKLTQEELYNFLKTYRKKYLRRELPEETYRNLDTGKFSMDNFELENIGKDELQYIDISQNYTKYLLPIFKAVL